MRITVTVGTSDKPEATHYEPKEKDMYINKNSGRYFVYNTQEEWEYGGCLKGVNIIEPNQAIRELLRITDQATSSQE